MSERTTTNINKEIAEKAPKIEKERAEFKTLIIENPNYFGTFPEVKTKPILPMKANTKYEELETDSPYRSLVCMISRWAKPQSDCSVPSTLAFG